MTVVTTAPDLETLCERLDLPAGSRVLDLCDLFNTATDGTLRIPGEYLEVIVTPAG